MLRPYKSQLSLAASGPSLLRRVCEVGSARFEVRIWYAALGAKPSPSQVSLSDWPALRGCSERGVSLPLSNSLTGPAACYRHSAVPGTSSCAFSAGRGGGSGDFLV